MYDPTLIELVATDGSPTVFAPAPLLPAEMKICMLNSSIVRLYSVARALLPSFRPGRPPIEMLTTSAPLWAAYRTPSIRPLLVQDEVVRQTLTAISCAPGAAPLIAPPNRPLAEVMPAT